MTKGHLASNWNQLQWLEWVRRWSNPGNLLKEILTRIGCRLPGDIRSPSQFWEMLINKQTGQTPRVPSSRFNIDAYFHSNNGRPGSFNVLGGYFLTEGLEEFDHTFFGISPIGMLAPEYTRSTQ